MLKLDRQELKNRLELSERKRIQLQKKMVAKKTIGEEAPLWTMVDLMTLLLIFFIFLYSPYVKGSLSASNNPQEDKSTIQIQKPPASQQTTEMKTLAQPDLAQPPDRPDPGQSEKLDKSIQQLHL